MRDGVEESEEQNTESKESGDSEPGFDGRGNEPAAVFNRFKVGRLALVFRPLDGALPEPIVEAGTSKRRRNGAMMVGEVEGCRIGAPRNANYVPGFVCGGGVNN